MTGIVKRAVVAASCVALAFTGLTACGSPDPNVAACAAWSDAMSAFTAAMDNGPHGGPPSPEQNATYDAQSKAITDGANSATGNVQDAFELVAKISVDTRASSSDLEGALGVLSAACVVAGS